MANTPAMEKAPAKTEAELIATVANIQDAEGSLLFAQRAIRAGMPALATACEERARTLKPIKPPRAKKKKPTPLTEAAEVLMAEEEITGAASPAEEGFVKGKRGLASRGEDERYPSSSSSIARDRR
jgi:hypothetical protein